MKKGRPPFPLIPIFPFFTSHGLGGKGWGTCSRQTLGGISHPPPLWPASLHRSFPRPEASFPSLRQVRQTLIKTHFTFFFFFFFFNGLHLSLSDSLSYLSLCLTFCVCVYILVLQSLWMTILRFHTSSSLNPPSTCGFSTRRLFGLMYVFKLCV